MEIQCPRILGSKGKLKLAYEFASIVYMMHRLCSKHFTANDSDMLTKEAMAKADKREKSSCTVG